MQTQQTQWSLRPATEDDLPELFRIEQECHRSPWGSEHFKTELEKPYSHLLVLTDDETDSKVAGYVVFWIMFDESQILNVVVDTPFRRTGLARNMIRQVARISHQKGVKRVVLEVRKSNMPAIQLYQNCSFSITHVRKKFYSDGEDAYHMTLFLEELAPATDLV